MLIMIPVLVQEKTNRTRATRWGRIILAGWLGLFLSLTITITLLTSPAVNAQVVARPPQRVVVHGDRLYVVRGRGGCVYMVHFTLTRQMLHARSYRVFGPERTFPVLWNVRGYEANANYNRNIHSCAPDRRHRAWQFELQAFR
jgi:hypothetical protein